MTLYRQFLGRELRAQRHRQQLRLVDVAAYAHVSHSHLSEIERGKKEASGELLEAICLALDACPSAVFREVSRRYAQAGW